MEKPIYYKTKVILEDCKTRTEAIDRANLIYISNPLANRLEEDKADKFITVAREKDGKRTYIAIISY